MDKLTVQDWTAAAIVATEYNMFAFMIGLLMAEVVRGWFDPFGILDIKQ